MKSDRRSDAHKWFLESLARERKKAGLTQITLGERLYKPQSYVAKYEGGERRIDVLEYVEIAKAIGFDPCSLIRKLIRR